MKTNVNTSMKHRNVFERLRYRFCHSVFIYLLSPMRKFYFRLRGAHIGKNVNLPHVIMTWPHQVWIGDSCVMESGIRFHHSGCLNPGPNLIVGDRTFLGFGCEFVIMKGIEIGKDCQFATGCKFIDINHEISALDRPINLQPCLGKPIKIEDDVWFGANVMVLPGVTVGQGAVVGAGAVVTKSIPSYEIWAGVPAKKIGQRTSGGDAL